MKKLLLCLTLLANVSQAAPQNIDLPTVMRLSGARNEEVEAARLQHRNALLETDQAWQKFWPSLSIGAQYRAHEGQTQDIAGNIVDVRKQQYTAGSGVTVDWAPGDLYYAALAAKQKAVAAGEGINKARLETIMEATHRYYEVLGAAASLSVIIEDVGVMENYAAQLKGAVDTGTAFRGDLLQIETQLALLKLQTRQGEESVQLAAARLAETLRLPPDTELRAERSDLVPVKVISAADLHHLVERALAQRPELKSAEALRAGLAREEERARVGVLVPTFQAGYSTGGFGGGRGGSSGHFDEQQDAFVGFGWKLEPGGIFDSTRQRLAVTRRESLTLQTEKMKAAIGREVVEAAIKSRSSEAQLGLSEKAVTAAEGMTKLAAERQASQVGVVLEFVVARQQLTRARLTRIRAIVDFGKAQQALKCAMGETGS